MSSFFNNLLIKDNLISNLNLTNNYSESIQFKIPYENCNYFRALSNQKALISVDFVKANYYLDLTSEQLAASQLTLSNSNIIEIGNPNIWYKTVGDYISSAKITLIERNPLLEGTAIQIEFEFIATIPELYTRNE